MELRQLRYFLRLAEELHFQRASRALCVTQPALSQQIKQLEEKLGVKLFERDKQSVKLTSAGDELQTRIAPVLQQLQQVIDDVKNSHCPTPSELTVSIPAYVGLKPLNRSFIRFAQAFPGVKLNKLQLPTNEIQDAVKEARIDCGFTPNTVTIPSMVVKKVTEGKWNLILPRDHPLAQHDELHFEQLDKLPLIFFARELNPVLHDWVLQELRKNGAEINVILEATQVSSGLEMVRERAGGYLLMDYLFDPANTDLKPIPLTGFVNKQAIYFIWHEDNKNPALKEFIQIIREEVDNEKGGL